MIRRLKKCKFQTPGLYRSADYVFDLLPTVSIFSVGHLEKVQPPPQKNMIHVQSELICQGAL